MHRRGAAGSRPNADWKEEAMIQWFSLVIAFVAVLMGPRLALAQISTFR